MSPNGQEQLLNDFPVFNCIWSAIGACALYLFVANFCLPKYVERRKSTEPSILVPFYYAGQIVFNVLLVFKGIHIILTSGWTELFGIPMTYEAVRLAQFYYINKFIDLAEPFIDQNKKICVRRSLFNVLTICLTLSMTIRHPGGHATYFFTLMSFINGLDVFYNFLLMVLDESENGSKAKITHCQNVAQKMILVIYSISFLISPTYPMINSILCILQGASIFYRDSKNDSPDAELYPNDLDVDYRINEL